MSKIGDVEQEYDIENSASSQKNPNKKIKQKTEELLGKLKNYDFLVSKNVYFEEPEEFPKLELDF